jgi:S-methylmethionine-dependent homocysteine/selenocysteine methylase
MKTHILAGDCLVATFQHSGIEGAIIIARQYSELTSRLKNLNVLRGCCGTDHRHIEEICKAFVVQL